MGESAKCLQHVHARVLPLCFPLWEVGMGMVEMPARLAKVGWAPGTNDAGTLSSQKTMELGG